MKKLLLLLTLITTMISFVGCQKDTETAQNISLSEIQNKIIPIANLKNAEFKNLTDINTAQSYGISKDDIEEGFVYSTTDENSDKIILVKAKGGPSTENVEKAIANEISSLISSWEDNSAETEKLKNHVLKTKDDYVLLAICENSDKIEKEFDNFFE